MIARLRAASRRDAGAAAVEFALLLPILLIVVFGIITFGLILFTQITAQHSAREAARQAAVGAFETCSGEATPTDLTYFIADDLKFDQATLTDVTLSRVDVDANGADPGDKLVISFTVPSDKGLNGMFEGIASAIPGAGFVLPDTLTVSAETRVEVVGDLSACP